MDIGTLTGSIELEDQLSSTLDVMTHRVQAFANQFDGMVGVVTVGALAITGAIAGAVGSIVALGEKGSVINGVEESFDKLAQTVGSTGATMFNALNEGLRGTVDSMQIMQSTTKLLSSGIKVSEENMNVMAKTAREMAKATGTDAATSLNQLSIAVQTGNTRMLKRIGINVDLVQAEKDFAKSLGTTRDQLNAAGIAQARADAIFQAFGDRLKKTGESALSFKERIQQANVAIGNWFDDLAKGVAKSSAVNTAFDTLSKSFIDTFGASSKTLQQNVLKWIDDFAAGVTKWGPIVIQAFGTVKDWIVQVWNELVNFNDRYQITNNIIAGARAAWGLLQTAFQLVRTAVQEVIAAWNSMPEWLQRITQGALSATLAVGAFSVGVGAVAAPLAALASKADLVINIFGNLSGAVYASLGLFDRFKGATAAAATALSANAVATAASTTSTIILTDATATATVATTQLTLAVRIQEAASAVLAFVYNSVTIALVFWQGAVTLTAERLGILTVITRANAIANAFATASYGYLGTAMAYVNGTAVVMGARMAFASLVTRAAGVAATGTAIAMGLLGTAIALVTGYFAFMLGLNIGTWLLDIKIFSTSAAEGIEYLSLVTQRWLGIIDRSATNEDLWNSVKANTAQRLKNEAAGYNEAAEAAKRLAEEEQRRRDALSGVTITKEIAQLAKDYASLTKEQQFNIDVMKRAGQQAEALRQQGGKLSPTLTFLADQYVALSRVVPEVTGDFIKAGTAADDFAKKVRDLGQSWANTAAGFTDNKAFTQAFDKLPKAQLANPEVQKVLVPGIDKLIEDGQQVTKVMQDIRAAVQAAELAKRALDKTTLEGSDITLESIASAKELGRTDTELAHNLGVTTEAFQKYAKQLADVRAITDGLVKAQDALIEQHATGEIKAVEARTAVAQQAPRIDYAAGLIGFEEFEARRRAIEENGVAERLQLEDARLARSEAIEQRELARKQARGELANASFAQLEQMRNDITERYSLMRVDIEREEATRRSAVAAAGEETIVKRELAGREALKQKEKEYTDFLKSTTLNAHAYQRFQIEQTTQSEVEAIAKRQQAGEFGVARAAELTEVALLGGKARIDALEKERQEMMKNTNIIEIMAQGFVDLADVVGKVSGATSKFGATFSALAKGIAASFQTLKMGNAAWKDYKKVLEDTGGATGTVTKAQIEQTKNFGLATALFDKNATSSQKWASGIASSMQVASGAMAIYEAGVNSASKAQGAFQGAMAGAQAGAAFGPWGIAIGGFIGAIGGLIGASRAGRKAIKEFAASFDTIAEGTGFDELHQQLLTLGDAGEQMWIDLTQGSGAGNAEEAKKKIAIIQDALAKLDADISKYGLTWRNLADQQSAAKVEAEKLAASFKRLTGAGYKVEDVLEGMGGDLNTFIINAIDAGVKIPQSMQPILQQFIRMGGLTREAANALMGLGTTGVPSLEDIRAAAERYGIELDELGPKVKQLEITELADQYVTDWKILTAATDDWGILFDKMGPKVQDLVTDAMKYGSELPAAMKPMIQAFIDAGRLTDANGEALTDLSQLHWEVDLAEAVDTLISKLNDLIDVITNGVGGALDGIGNRTVSPKVNMPYVPPTSGGEYAPPINDNEGGVPGTRGTGNSYQEPQGGSPDGYYAGGGVVQQPVYAARGGMIQEPAYHAEGGMTQPSYLGGRDNVVAFTPRGTDTVPAMLTPGETVTPARETQEKGGGTAIFMMDGKTLAKAQVPATPGIVKRYRLKAH